MRKSEFLMLEELKNAPHLNDNDKLLLGCDFFSPNTNTQIHKRRFFISAKEKKVCRDETPSIHITKRPEAYL